MTRNLKEFVNHDEDLRSSPDLPGARHVAVLLAHYNGAELLGEQLQSLGAQTHRDWSLILSDDGSSDDWSGKVADFAASEPGRRVWVVNGPRRGYAQNFLSLACAAGPGVPFAAFSDQDDVWLPDKLERALAALAYVAPGVPALYCSRTMVCDHDLVPIGLSPFFGKSPGFRNALVQSIGGGNTMVLNRAALDLLQDTARHATGIVSHDWWTYQIVSGSGGRVIYDMEPSLLYRQHGANLIGANASWRARWKRLRQLLQGQFREWSAANASALAASGHWLTEDAGEVLAAFDTVRNGPLLQRLAALKRSGLYRQTPQGQIALWLAAMLGKL